MVAVLRDALTQLGLEPKATRASIQGFGNVAQHAARRYVQLGGTLTAVSSWHAGDERAYTIRKESGIDPDAMSHITDAFGSIDKTRAEELGYEVVHGISVA